MMKLIILVLVCFIMIQTPSFAWWKNKNTVTVVDVKQGSLVKKIVVIGFLLHDERVYSDLNKKYRMKYLSDAEIDGIINELEAMYREKGYIGLVDSSHTFNKGILTIRMNLSQQ